MPSQRHRRVGKAPAEAREREGGSVPTIARAALANEIACDNLANAEIVVLRGNGGHGASRLGPPYARYVRSRE